MDCYLQFDDNSHNHYENDKNCIKVYHSNMHLLNHSKDTAQSFIKHKESTFTSSDHSSFTCRTFNKFARVVCSTASLYLCSTFLYGHGFSVPV